MKWLLCDYGEVLTPAIASRPGGARDRGRGGRRGLLGPYWQHRPAYDSGHFNSARYWMHALGKALSDTRVCRLQQIDTVMWSRPNQPSLQAASQGTQLVVLSDAPAELADSFDRLPWLAPFAPRLFSGRLGIIKPEPTIFLAALNALHARPADVSFIDDRPENVLAARRAGLRATLFTDPRDPRGLAGRGHGNGPATGRARPRFLARRPWPASAPGRQ